MTDVAIVHCIPIGYQHALFTELARQGLRFTVLYTAGASRQRLEVPDLSKAAYQYRIGFKGSYENASGWRSFVFVLKSLNQIRPAAVIIGGWSDAASWAAWLWGGMRRRPRILWMESTECDHPRAASKERIKTIFLHRCHMAHVYGTKSKEYLVKLGMPESRIETGRALVDADLFSPPKARRSHSGPERVVLYVGRFSTEKNLPTLLRAMQICLSQRCKSRLILALVGYGPQEDELRALSVQLGIADAVQFWGPATQDKLAALYRTADVLVLPSLSEPWGLVVNEAMLCGLPVLVSSRCGCAADLVRPETGWTFSPADVDSLASLLVEVSDLPEALLLEMGRAARQRALAYTPSEIASSIISYVRCLTGQLPRARAAQAAA